MTELRGTARLWGALLLLSAGCAHRASLEEVESGRSFSYRHHFMHDARRLGPSRGCEADSQALDPVVVRDSAGCHPIATPLDSSGLELSQEVRAGLQRGRCLGLWVVDPGSEGGSSRKALLLQEAGMRSVWSATGGRLSLSDRRFVPGSGGGNDLLLVHDEAALRAHPGFESMEAVRLRLGDDPGSKPLFEACGEWEQVEARLQAKREAGVMARVNALGGTPMPDAMLLPLVELSELPAGRSEAAKEAWIRLRARWELVTGAVFDPRSAIDRAEYLRIASWLRATQLQVGRVAPSALHEAPSKEGRLFAEQTRAGPACAALSTAAQARSEFGAELGPVIEWLRMEVALHRALDACRQAGRATVAAPWQALEAIEARLRTDVPELTSFAALHGFEGDAALLEWLVARPAATQPGAAAALRRAGGAPNEVAEALFQRWDELHGPSLRLSSAEAACREVERLPGSALLALVRLGALPAPLEGCRARAAAALAPLAAPLPRETSAPCSHVARLVAPKLPVAPPAAACSWRGESNSVPETQSSEVPVFESSTVEEPNPEWVKWERGAVARHNEIVRLRQLAGRITAAGSGTREAERGVTEYRCDPVTKECGARYQGGGESGSSAFSRQAWSHAADTVEGKLERLEAEQAAEPPRTLARKVERRTGTRRARTAGHRVSIQGVLTVDGRDTPLSWSAFRSASGSPGESEWAAALAPAAAALVEAWRSATAARIDAAVQAHPDGPERTRERAAIRLLLLGAPQSLR